MYGLDISKTLNTEHHWKMKNFKVREDFFTGQLKKSHGSYFPDISAVAHGLSFVRLLQTEGDIGTVLFFALL